MDIAVLDYTLGNVSIYRNVDTYDPEEYLKNEGYDLDEIYYLTSEDIEVYEYNN